MQNNINQNTLFITDFSDLIKNNICPHCRGLFENDTIILHVKTCSYKEKTITTKWFTKKEMKKKDKFDKEREEIINHNIHFYKADRPQTR